MEERDQVLTTNQVMRFVMWRENLSETQCIIIYANKREEETPLQINDMELFNPLLPNIRMNILQTTLRHFQGF